MIHRDALAGGCCGFAVHPGLLGAFSVSVDLTVGLPGWGLGACLSFIIAILYVRMMNMASSWGVGACVGGRIEPLYPPLCGAFFLSVTADAFAAVWYRGACLSYILKPNRKNLATIY